MNLEQEWDKLRAREDQSLTEVHVVNGLHPDLPFDYYLDLLRGFKRIRSDVHLKCFTAVEIAFFADDSGEHLENITTTTNQLYHMEKQEVRRKRYSRRGSAMAKAQQTMYVLLAGGLGFLLFIIFSEVTEKAP